VRQLVAEGCAIAMCDVSARGMAETQHLCETAGLPQGLRVTHGPEYPSVGSAAPGAGTSGMFFNVTTFMTLAPF
jgi:hypothetical protein